MLQKKLWGAHSREELDGLGEIIAGIVIQRSPHLQGVTVTLSEYRRPDFGDVSFCAVGEFKEISCAKLFVITDTDRTDYSGREFFITIADYLEAHINEQLNVFADPALIDLLSLLL